MRFSLVFLFVFFVVISLSSDTEAEEEFTISVDPGWMEENARNCKTITANVGNSTEDGTYEECDYYLEYETNLTNDDYSWFIGDDGTRAEWRNKYDNSYLPYTPNSLNSTFVFSLHGTNFSKNIEYTFSYVVYSHLDYKEWEIEQELSQITLTEYQVTFFGNDSIETNLSGTFNGGVAIDSWISEDVETLVLKDECSTVYANVKLEGKNVSTGNTSLSETYLSGGFFLNDTTEEKCKLVYSFDDAGYISLGDYTLFIGLFLVFGLAILYVQAKLTSWHFTGSYSNKSTQYLAILVSAILFIFLAMFPVAFCIAAIVLFAQFVAYYTGHYDKPEVFEEDQPKPK